MNIENEEREIHNKEENLSVCEKRQSDGGLISVTVMMMVVIGVINLNCCYLWRKLY